MEIMSGIIRCLIWPRKEGDKLGKRRKRTQFEESLLLNQHTYWHYVRVITEIALSRFTWKGLPDTVDERYMELKLFENGSVIYFNDDVIGNLCLSMLYSGSLGVYGEPIRRTAWSGYNRYSKECNPKDSVIVWNNMSKTNSVLMVELYARKLWNMDRAVDINVNAQKTPILLQGPEEQKLTLENAYKDYDGNMPVIHAYKGFNTAGISAISTGAPFVSDKIYEIKTKYWNEILTYLGIVNVSVMKKERVNTDEVNRSLGGTYGCRQSPLKMRQKAAVQINKMFGTNITVEFAEPDIEDVGLKETEEAEDYDE